MSEKQSNKIIRDSRWMLKWLDTALDMEKRKYKSCPVKQDMMPGHEAAQAWGYVVAGYSLVEQSFKGLLYVRGEDKVLRKHSLSALFNMLIDEDKRVIREYFTDFRMVLGNTGNWFRLKSVDTFLENLDGEENSRKSDRIGSFVWRYYLIEESDGPKMPIVSVEFLHEISYACNRILEFLVHRNFQPMQYTYSKRMK